MEMSQTEIDGVTYAVTSMIKNVFYTSTKKVAHYEYCDDSKNCLHVAVRLMGDEVRTRVRLITRVLGVKCVFTTDMSMSLRVGLPLAGTVQTAVRVAVIDVLNQICED